MLNQAARFFADLRHGLRQRHLSDQGGGVDAQFGTSTLTDCTISGNSVANYAGGGVANMFQWFGDADQLSVGRIHPSRRPATT